MHRQKTLKTLEFLFLNIPNDVYQFEWSETSTFPNIEFKRKGFAFKSFTKATLVCMYVFMYEYVNTHTKRVSGRFTGRDV